MKISNNILNAIIEAVKVAGSASEFSRLAGINRSMLCRYLKGQVKSISDESWEKLRPLIISYINTDALDLSGERPVCSEHNRCPLRNDEDREILNYFSASENKLKRYKLLLEIEEAKIKTKVETER